MEQKEKFFFWICVGVLGLSLLVVFWKFLVLRDYTVILQIPCDPAREICFIAQCDPADAECADVLEQEPFYYKRLEKTASRIPECGPKEYCPPLGCAADEENCQEVLCASENVAEGEACSESMDVAPATEASAFPLDMGADGGAEALTPEESE